MPAVSDESPKFTLAVFLSLPTEPWTAAVAKKPKSRISNTGDGRQRGRWARGRFRGGHGGGVRPEER